jgi:eukaryotic-like serine/threonine-protein kinase
MNPQRWREIDRLLSEALKREPGERKDFLQQTCNADDDLRNEVSLLEEAHDRAAGFMEEPALDPAARLSPASLIGRNVGPFEILSLLGRGDMGEVYKVRNTGFFVVDRCCGALTCLCRFEERLLGAKFCCFGRM